MEFLISEGGVDEAEARRAAALSRGSIGRALGFLEHGDRTWAPGGHAQRGHGPPLSSARPRAPRTRIRVALSFKPVGCPWPAGPLQLPGRVPRRSGSGGLRPSARSRPGRRGGPFFEEAVARWKLHPGTVPHALKKVDEARSLAAGNVNPQLVIFGLLHDLGQELTNPGLPPEPRR